MHTYILILNNKQVRTVGSKEISEEDLSTSLQNMYR